MWDEPDASRRRKKRKKQRFRDDDAVRSRRPRYEDDLDWEADDYDESDWDAVDDDDDRLALAESLGDDEADWEEHDDWDDAEDADAERE